MPRCINNIVKFDAELVWGDVWKKYLSGRSFSEGCTDAMYSVLCLVVGRAQKSGG